MKQHPDQLIAYAVRTEVVIKKRVWKDKEDSHGGPGYYEEEDTLVKHYQEISGDKVQRSIFRVARGEHLT